MADIKVSQLSQASSAAAEDVFMTVQNGISKQINLATLLNNLNSNNNIRINPDRTAIDVTIASFTTDTMLKVDGVNGRVGINTATPLEKLHVGGNIAIDGIIRSIPEELIATTQPADNVGISALHEITSLQIYGASTYSLGIGAQGQAKYIYVASANDSAATATITVAEGLGFNRIVFSTTSTDSDVVALGTDYNSMMLPNATGKGVVLIYSYDSWICVGNNGAKLTTV